MSVSSSIVPMSPLKIVSLTPPSAKSVLSPMFASVPAKPPYNFTPEGIKNVLSLLFEGDALFVLSVAG